MKSEPKAFASLSSGLLARKGAARPAMRPQGFGQTGAGLEDLGWNDMGFEAPKPAAAPLRDASHDAFGDEIAPAPSRNPLAALSPVHSPVHSQRAEIVERLAPAFDDDGEDEYDDTAEIYEPEADQETVALPESDALEATGDETVSVREAVSVDVELEPAEAEPSLGSAATAHPSVSRSARAPKSRAAPGSKAKAAFTLRLDRARHLKLRLACAVGGRSAQQVVTQALDALLAEMPELDAMAAKANRKG